jgi:Type I restriction-modification system methyltransferase subunit
MAARAESRISFASIRIEGSLLLPDVLAKIAAGTAPEQSDSSYEILPGLQLRADIARFWQVARTLWARLEDGRAGANPVAVRMAFARDVLTKVLGFEFDDGGDRSKSGFQSAAAKKGSVLLVISGEGGVDEVRSITASSGKPIRKTPTAWLQQQLNSTDNALWGIAVDGMRLRLLRDNESLTRPAMIEVDLDKIFREGLHDEFNVFWLLCHHTRFGRGDGNPEDCPLEHWRNQGRTEGVTARDRLRDGVERALFHFGTGLLEHPGNHLLRQRLLGNGGETAEALAVQDFHKELLRFVYRLIFLMTAEDRGVLLDDKAAAEAQNLFRRGYSTDLLRERSRLRAAWDRHQDAYHGIRVLVRAAAFGEPRLGIPALGGIFAPDQCPNIEELPILNERFLQGLFHLSWMEHDKALVRVNWRDMETEELGSVYESLLELTPAISENAGRFYFVNGEGDETAERQGVSLKGNSRKTTSSYYTPDTLVQFLLDRTLDPVIDRTVAENPGEPEALLKLDIIDPSCGSGHFLLGAARRVANKLAELRTEGSATESDYRHAMRDVITNCIYGVDRNEFAVELCRVAMWLESVDPGRPLGFLNNRIVLGDALVGLLSPELMRVGVPNEAYDALEGDDKDVCRDLKRWNREFREGNFATGMYQEYAIPPQLVEAANDLIRMPDGTLEDIHAQEEAFRALVESDPWRRYDRASDAFVSAFFTPKTGPVTVADTNGIPTTDTVWRAIRDDEAGYQNTAAEAKAFHWYLAFPHVFDRGGFDVVVGNPPWDTMSPDAKEFFSIYDSGIRFMSPQDQDQRVAELKAVPGVEAGWNAYCRHLYASAAFFKKSGRYKLFAEGNLGKGDFNIYRMFVELALNLVKPGGRVAQFVPENLYNGANAAAIRRHLFDHFTLDALVGFENTKRVWFDIDTRAKFCLYVASPAGRTAEFPAAFGINSREKLADLKEGLPFEIPVELVREFSPDAMAVAEIVHKSDIVIARKLYARFPKFGEDIEGLPRREYAAELHMGNDRDDFSSDEGGIPVYEGRMVEAFDHRAKAYVSGRGRAAVWRELPFGSGDKAIAPQWRISEEVIPQKIGTRWQRYRIGFCDVASPTNQRALVAALIPPDVICGDKVPTLEVGNGPPELHLLLLAVMNSFCLDFVARKKVALKMAFNVVDSLPLPREYLATPTERAIVQRSLLLAATGPEMDSFWRQSAPLVGLDPAVHNPEEDPEKRHHLRTELDVLVARDLYGLSRDEMAFILDPADVLGSGCEFETFGALKRAEVRQFGRFVTRDLILSAWNSPILPVEAENRAVELV